MKRTGTIASWVDAEGNLRYRARIHLKDGAGRPWVSIDKGTSKEDAKRLSLQWQLDEDRTHALYNAKQQTGRDVAAVERRAHPLETADAWFVRYLPTTSGGEANRLQHSHNWGKWMSPRIGTRDMASLTREDVEDVRDHLDRSIAEGVIREKTASNIWSTFKLVLQAACAAKDRTLRCHPAPLHFGILPPTRGRSRNRPWLYPNEWVKLLKCSAVPVEWLSTYAVALYTGLRPNEHRVLLGADADLKALQIAVSKAWDSRTRKVGPPKTPAAYRSVPIEATLVPLLKRLKRMAGAGGAISPLLSTDRGRDAAIIFRGHLELAGVKRARLFADNQTEESIDFRSLRDTYATWLALIDLPLSKIQRRLGHTSPETTNKYIKAAESFDPAAIGTPFPALPKRLVEP